MRNVLPGTICLIVLSVFLSVRCLAFTNLPLPKSVSGHPSFPGSNALTIAAPANVTVNTDPYNNIASGVVLGTPVTSGNNVTVKNNAPSTYPIGNTTVVWTAADNEGATATATQTVTVTDNEKPSVHAMGEISVVNDAGTCGARVDLSAFTPYTFDNSGTVYLTNDAPSVFHVGSFRVTWTATDPYGNSDTSTQLITVIDNELPTISFTNRHIVVGNEGGKCSASVDLGTPVTQDNCGIASVTNDAPAIFPVGKTVVTWTVKDLTGYVVTATQDVTVNDQEKPTIQVTGWISVGNDPGKCGAVVNLGTPVTSDNCGIASVTNNAPAFFTAGTTIVTWTVTDNNGNLSTATQTILVNDVEAPSLTGIPVNANVGCDNIPGVATTPRASDNCDPAPVIIFDQVSTQSSNLFDAAHYNYTITRTWTAKDASGNSARASQAITVADKTAPVINAPANISVNNDANVCGATVNFAASAVDNCGSAVTIGYSKNPATVFPTGITTVTITAKDVSGNTSTRSFTVTVTDIQKPTVTAPPNITVTANNGNSATNVNLGTPATADNCGVKSITNNAPSSYLVGQTTVTWTVKDNSGNCSTAQQTVTVTKKKSNAVSTGYALTTQEQSKPEEGLQIGVAPNPSTTHFTLTPQSRNGLPVMLRIINASGRVIETRAGLVPNTTVEVGHNYYSGIYFAEMIQGSRRKVVQLIKLK